MYAACGFTTWHFLPDDWTELETYNAVQNLARLLSFNELHINRAWICHGVGNSVFGNFVEDDSFCRERVEAEYFAKVPSDSFSFAVFIGCKPDVFFADGFYLLL